MSKTIRATGDMKYAGVFIPKMLEYINEKKGIDCGYAKNHNTVSFTLENGEIFNASAYETKSMTIIKWYKVEV